MYLEHLWINDFRNYKEAELLFPTTGLTLITGSNGEGKSNLLEAIGYMFSLRSFRNSTSDALVRSGAERAVLRGEGSRSGRRLLIEAEVPASGRTRVLVNRQSMTRVATDDRLLSTVFSPDDLVIVKGGPNERRNYLDELLADGSLRIAALIGDLARVLKQRNALLKSVSGRLTADAEFTLDVWDSKMTELGEQLADSRRRLVESLIGPVNEAYGSIASRDQSKPRVGMRMISEWHPYDGGKGLLETLQANRAADVARGITSVGPHRDECLLTLNGMPARTHASQGEQRSLALALRLGGHRLLSDTSDTAPAVLLDDVFSELDEHRSAQLLEALPVAQTFLTTATNPPSGASPELRISVKAGRVELPDGKIS